MGKAVEPLTRPQSEALRVIGARLDASYYLAGGVAVALNFRHRQSIDLDIFTDVADPSLLAPHLAADSDVRIVGRGPTTLHLDVRSVPVTLLRYPYPLLRPPVHEPTLPLCVASVDDLISMKLLAIAGRGAARDFWDLHTMLEREQRTLSSAIALFEEKFTREDAGHMIRSLVYFGDANAAPLPSGLGAEAWNAMQADFKARVLAL